MSAVPSPLLLDMGNTRLKYAWCHETTGLLEVQSLDSFEALQPLIAESSRVLVANVGCDEKLHKIERLCEEHRKDLYIAQTEASRFGVHCAYENFETLGVDRWLAILAARSITPLPLAVIDIGTAATCDVVVGNKHEGGWIAPGFELMRQGLIGNTQKVFANTRYPDSLVFADTTEECVNMGCLSAIQGLVVNAERLLARHHKDYRIIICGGGKSLVSELKNDLTIVEENLVLQGLRLFL